METRNLLADEDSPRPKPGLVWITRARWDRLFLTAAPAAAVIIFISWRYTESPRILSGAVGYLALWAVLRWGWPREGSYAAAIASTPGLRMMLGWLLICLIIGIGGACAIDTLFPDTGPPTPWRKVLVMYAFLFAWVTVLCIGVARIDRLSKKPSAPDDRMLE